MDFKNFWVRIATGFDKVMRDYKDFNVITRVVLLLVIDTPICETGYSALNRIQTKTRLLIPIIRDVLTAQQHGPNIKDFDPAPICEEWVEKPYVDGSGVTQLADYLLKQALLTQGAEKAPIVTMEPLGHVEKADQ